MFHPDPGDGFPPGSPADASVVSSWHGVLHQVCGTSAFLALIALCFVFGRRFARTGQRRMAVGTQVAHPVRVVAEHADQVSLALVVGDDHRERNRASGFVSAYL